jgi:hypothetical protein
LNNYSVEPRNERVLKSSRSRYIQNTRVGVLGAAAEIQLRRTFMQIDEYKPKNEVRQVIEIQL